MGGVFGCLLERLDDDPLHVFVADAARDSWAGLVVEPVQTPLHEAPPPLTDRRLVQPEPLGHQRVVRPLGARQHDPTPQRQRLSALRAARPALERLPLVVTQHQLGLRSSTPPHGTSVRFQLLKRESSLTQDTRRLLK